MFRCSHVALVTPMQNDQVDIKRLCELVEFHIQAGTHGIIAAGTTGESGTLSREEKICVIKTVVDQARNRIPVIAGTAMNGTKACIELTREAMALGADAALIMTPAYIKPTQEGLYQHYSQIAAEVPIPIILYNVPSRTACDLLPETVEKLSHISNIVALKDATAEMSRLQQMIQDCEGRIDILSGDDPTAADWMLAGAKGVISVTANVAPKQMAELCDAAYHNHETLCKEIDQQLAPLHRLLFCESNPIPTKWALHQMGLISEEIRRPLTPLSKAHQAPLSEALSALKLL